MTDVTIHDAAPVAPTERPEARVLTVLVDSRASSIMLVGTIRDIIDEYSITEVIINANSPAGENVANELGRLDIPFWLASPGVEGDSTSLRGDTLGMAQPAVRVDDTPFYDEDNPLLDLAVGQLALDLSTIHQTDAMLVIVPAMVGSTHEVVDLLRPSDGSRTDLTPRTIPGAVVSACSAVERQLLVIEPPERGLVSIPISDEVYETLAPFLQDEVESGTLLRRRTLNIGYNSNVKLNPTGESNQNSQKE